MSTDKTTPPRFVSVDLAHGKDRTAKAEVERLPDGALRLVSLWTYTGTIEGQADVE